MSEKTKTDQICEELKLLTKDQLEALKSKADIQPYADKYGVSPSLIRKVKRRLLEEKAELGEPTLPEGKEPTIKIPKVSEKELIPPEELEDIEEGVPIEETAPPTLTIPEVQVTDKDVEAISGLILGRIAGFTKWDGWLLTDQEKKEWCPKCANMLNKYAPTILVKYFPEVMFTVTTLTIFGGKYADYKLWKQEQEAKTKPPEATTQPPQEIPTPPPQPRTEIATELTPEEIDRRKREQTPAFKKLL